VIYIYIYIYIYIDECNLYFTSFCGGVVRQIFDSFNLVVSLAGGSTEVRDGNSRTLSVTVSPRDGSSQARVPTGEALQFHYPKKCLVSSTDHEASHYAFFSSLLSFSPS